MKRLATPIVLVGLFLIPGLTGAVATSNAPPRSARSASPRVIAAARQNAKGNGNAVIRALDIPPRFQWDGNFGYCGEVSMISAGLYYGQYVSQYDMRAAANEPGFAQARRRAQILISMNDAQAARNMHLKLVNWSGTGAENFLVWVRRNIAMGYPVTIGVLERESKEPTDGSNYDHIVPVNAVTSSYPFDDGLYHEDDEIQFSDNYGGDEPGKHTSPASSYLFRYKFKAFLKTRKQLDESSHEYALGTDRANFGWAVTGVMDEFGETVPVSVKTDKNYEDPEIHDGGNGRPNPRDLTLTITVRGLKPGVEYKLYRYDKLSNVPDGRFNANAGKAARIRTIKIDRGDTHVLTENIRSNEIAVYRAVPASAR